MKQTQAEIQLKIKIKYILKKIKEILLEKIYLNNAPKINAFKIRDNEDIINLKNINNNHTKYFDDKNNTQIYNNINKMNNSKLFY